MFQISTSFNKLEMTSRYLIVCLLVSAVVSQDGTPQTPPIDPNVITSTTTPLPGMMTDSLSRCENRTTQPADVGTNTDNILGTVLNNVMNISSTQFITIITCTFDVSTEFVEY